jgi:hypothetical protein
MLATTRRFLIRLLGGDLPPTDHGEPEPAPTSLEARVRELEAIQLQREIEWAAVSEKLQRYLKRISAVEGRAAAREEGGGELAPQTRALLQMKFPQQKGG